MILLPLIRRESDLPGLITYPFKKCVKGKKDRAFVEGKLGTSIMIHCSGLVKYLEEDGF